MPSAVAPKSPIPRFRAGGDAASCIATRGVVSPARDIYALRYIARPWVHREKRERNLMVFQNPVLSALGRHCPESPADH
jgi:hypothetical protein